MSIKATYRCLVLAAFIWVGAGYVIVSNGCQNPSHQVQAITTLKVLGEARHSLMLVAQQLWIDGKIDAKKKDEIIDAHEKFQVAYRAAVAGVQIDSPASPHLLALFSELQTLVNSSK